MERSTGTTTSFRLGRCSSELATRRVDAMTTAFPTHDVALTDVRAGADLATSGARYRAGRGTSPCRKHGGPSIRVEDRRAAYHLVRSSDAEFLPLANDSSAGYALRLWRSGQKPVRDEPIRLTLR